MPGPNFSQPLLGAGASAQTDFAAAKARTGLDFLGAARFKRGVKVELGLEAFADASAELSKFVRASIEGTAFARAKAGVQLQLPLNLFDEFGFAVRAEAIAEAAAGVEGDIGLSVGDFILLAQRDQDLTGLPLELLLLFLEEVSIGGAFEVNVSASAKAHASVTVTGCVVEKAGRKAGFFYTVDAGVGLAAGVGMGARAGAEFKDFRRFYGRATDKAVDGAVVEITKLLPESAKDVVPILGAFAPVAKIALRIAYDVGRKVAENRPGGSKQDMNTLCNEAVKTFLEECQRFIIGKMLDGALDTIRKALERQAASIGQAAWDGALQERTSLATQLLAMPDEPFQPTQANIDYWNNTISRAVNLLTRLYVNRPDPALVEALCALFCASELSLEAVRAKVNRSSAYAMAIGAGTVNADTQPFRGALPAQPPALIKNAINSALRAQPNRNLTYADLLQYLSNDILVNGLLAAFPEANQFVGVFKSAFGKAENEILKMFLQNAAAFVPDAAGGRNMDPHKTLQLIVGALDSFITDKFRQEALPMILSNVGDANVRLYVEEVLFGAVVYVKDVALKSILSWEGKTFDNDDFTESLAAVMTLLLGRTVVIVADTLLTATQERIAETCDELAGKIRGGHPDIRRLGLPADADFVRLAADSVKIAGEVLGPLPPETRARVRRLLYQVFEPIPPGAGQNFLESLGDDFFIPNGDDLRELTDELAAISKRRFALFAERFVLAVGEYILEQLEEILLQIIDLIVNWETHLADSLDELAALLRSLDDEIARLNRLMVNLFQMADDGLRQFLNTLSGPSLRSGIKAALKDLFVDKALGVLEHHDAYKNLPRGLRSGVRATLRSSINGLVNGPVVDPVLDAVGQVADSLEDLLLDSRELDPDDNLPEQIMLLVLDKIEDNIREHFGGSKPRINVGFDIGFTDLFGNRHSTHISLGRIEVNLNPFLDAVRDAIRELDFYHDELNAACSRLAQALAKELEIAAAELRKKEKEEKKRRLDKIAAEHDSGPKEIAVLNPAPLSHHTMAVGFKIHLGGVPLSFLGLEEDESQRVLIYLNGELVPVKSLLVEEATFIKNAKEHVTDFNLAGSKAFDAGTGIFKNGVASIITDTARQIPAHSAYKRLRQEAAGHGLGSYGYRELAVAKSASAGGSRKDGRAPALGVGVRVDGQGRTVKEYAFKNVNPGRANPPSRMNKLLEERMPGVLLQFRVGLDELVEGVNVLTVVVVEKGGNRHQQNVSFTAAKARPSGLGLTLPGVALPGVALPGVATPPAVVGGKSPKKPVIFNLGPEGSGAGAKTRTVNLMLPVNSESLKKRKQAALQYLREQDKLNLPGK